MIKTDFNKGWLFCREGEKEYIATDVPHDAMLREPRTDDSEGGTNTGWFAGCDYEYIKEFDVSSDIADRELILEFEGVYRNAEVYVNGEKAAFHPYGYGNFYVNITDKVKEGKNTVLVKAKNADQPNSRWYTGAGIYRPVWLYVLPKKHICIDGVKVRTLSYAERRIEVAVGTTDGGSLSISVSDGNSELYSLEAETDGAFRTEITLPCAELWSPEHCKLYDLTVRFGQDEQTVRFGIREVTCTAREGLKINGERIVLNGACIHHDNGLIGAAAHPFAEERKIRLLQENGYNAIRSAHNPCSKALLDACDRLGMLVMDEYADMWYIHKTKYDYADHFEKMWKQDLSDLIDKDYNHPSVIMYSIGNEVAETAQERGIAFCREMTEFIKERDDRTVTCGINLFFNYLSSMGMGVYSDKKAEQNAKKAQSKKKKKAVGSEFFNNLAGLLGAKFMKFGATLRGSDRKTRDAFAVLDVAGYNYGIGRYKKDVKKYPDRIIVGSETFVFDAYKFSELSQKYPSVIGDFVWTGIDYLGEVGLGAWEYSDYAPDFSHGVGWIAAGSGRLDITGRPWGEAAYTRVAFGLDKIRIAVVPVNHTKDKHSPAAWRMTNAMESWAWNGCEGKTAKVEVYARGAKAALLLNGRKIAEKKIKKDCRTVFKVKYRDGELKAVSYDSEGKELASASLVTAGEKTVLSAVPERRSVKKNELIYLPLRYTDEKGILKPLARGEITLSVSGGRLLGFGNGCAYCENGYLGNVSDTYFGEAMAVIMPDEKGKVTVNAESRFGQACVSVEVTD